MQTAQEIYDVVRAHLLKQGEKSVDGSEERCAYRSPSGRKCAVGVLIPDEKYSSDMEGKDCDAEFLEDFCLQELRPHVALIAELQFVHDHCEPHRWPARLAEAAEQFGLVP